ncbi:MAG: UbiA family prenyltransferase [Akkermansiaceae bacterium]|jgi:4-hydroxybenzoate polyprenyltransferase|nr:UbiA family prenyltransferase [Akkermansiaceae bacterium]
MSRWWIYQKERFPVFAHGPLIAAFSACAVAFSSMLRGAAPPQWQSYLTAFGVCLLMFFQLRIADEFKDREEDARWRPYRPVPRGLVKLSELRVVFIIAALLQIALVLAHDFRLLLVLAAAWTYFTLMSVEFFCRDWLKARPVVYLLTHMGIMPLVDFFGTACEWLPRGASAPSGLGWFLTASFFNGIVIEIGRKLRQPADEEEGVETYSRLWGKSGGAAVWLAAMSATLGCAAMAAARIGFVLPVLTALGSVLAIALIILPRYLRGQLPGKRIESLTGLWTLTLYLMLGIVPLWLRG